MVNNNQNLQGLATKTKTKKLSVRDRETIKGIMAGKPVETSMRDAGYAIASARGNCSEKALELAPTIQALMEKRGITDDKLLDVLVDGLKCKRALVVDKEVVDVDDYPTRHRYFDTALRIKRHLTDKDDSNQDITIVINKL